MTASVSGEAPHATGRRRGASQGGARPATHGSDRDAAPGVPLEKIGLVLRHQGIDMTAYYAKAEATADLMRDVAAAVKGHRRRQAIMTPIAPTSRRSSIIDSPASEAPVGIPATHMPGASSCFRVRWKRRKVSPSAPTLEQLDAGLISAFLEYLEDKRKNAPVTRNVRLAAIKSFFHSLEYRQRAAREHVRRVLAIPFKKTDRTGPLSSAGGDASGARRSGSRDARWHPRPGHAASGSS